MEKQQSAAADQLLNLTLEIIYLLTGEDCAAVRTSIEPSVLAILSGHLQKKRKINVKKIVKVTGQIIGLLAEEDWSDGDGDAGPRERAKTQDCGTQTEWPSNRSPSEPYPGPLDQQTQRYLQGGDAGGVKVEYVAAEEGALAEQGPAYITQDGQYSQSASTGTSPALPSLLKVEGKGSRQHIPGEDAIDLELHPELYSTDILSRSSNTNWLVDPVNVRKRSLSSSKIYPCTECGRCFTSMSNCMRHMKIHKGEKPFICDHCGKSFARKSHVAMHQRAHTGEKPFCCALCGKFFKHKSHLVIHNRTHTGEKPFRCLECGKCFTQKSNLLCHQKVHGCGKT